MTSTSEDPASWVTYPVPETPGDEDINTSAIIIPSVEILDPPPIILRADYYLII
jgi:hypothetical protein